MILQIAMASYVDTVDAPQIAFEKVVEVRILEEI